MPDAGELTTERLRLIPFAMEHLEGLYEINADPDVMRYIRPVQTKDEVENWITGQQSAWAKYGFGWWAIVHRDTQAVIGAACLQHLAHLETNPLEIGWRLRPAAQGKGYATEAGRAAMAFAFNVIGVSKLMSVAHPENVGSTRVMERLGMTYVGIQTHYDVPCATYEIYRPARG